MATVSRDVEIKVRVTPAEHAQVEAATPPGIAVAAYARSVLLAATAPSTAVDNPVRNPTPEPKDTP